MKADDKSTAEKIREACAREFIRAYEEAGIKGLCVEGRIEYAVDAVRSMNLEKFLSKDQHKK